ncbi:MAG: YHS domain-containing protein [Chloroflexota bacterium]|nr:YHS domain-containing protein [Chloroflexota bacterium]
MPSGKILDPICDMIVDLADAREHGLTLEYPEREYGFCSAGCLAKFAKNPSAYKAKVEGWLAAQAAAPEVHAHPTSGETPVIDAGIRAWYSSCRCCLSDAHPSVVEALDRERAQMHEAPVDPGLCETAEAQETKTT